MIFPFLIYLYFDFNFIVILLLLPFLLPLLFISGFNTKISVGELYVGEAKETESEDRRLVIYLDNTQSKLRAKTLIYQALIATPDKIQELKG